HRLRVWRSLEAVDELLERARLHQSFKGGICEEGTLQRIGSRAGEGLEGRGSGGFNHRGAASRPSRPPPPSASVSPPSANSAILRPSSQSLPPLSRPLASRPSPSHPPIPALSRRHHPSPSQPHPPRSSL